MEATGSLTDCRGELSYGESQELFVNPLECQPGEGYMKTGLATGSIAIAAAA